MVYWESMERRVWELQSQPDVQQDGICAIPVTIVFNTSLGQVTNVSSAKPGMFHDLICLFDSEILNIRVQDIMKSVPDLAPSTWNYQHTLNPLNGTTTAPPHQRETSHPTLCWDRRLPRHDVRGKVWFHIYWMNPMWPTPQSTLSNNESTCISCKLINSRKQEPPALLAPVKTHWCKKKVTFVLSQFNCSTSLYYLCSYLFGKDTEGNVNRVMSVTGNPSWPSPSLPLGSRTFNTILQRFQSNTGDIWTLYLS